ncbi:hypothetical protein HDU96_003246 [Phlyctochytrium bullatum]|nr:hypothetical protein HDU96_003246 [Phlyctochytrium bullatum]
MGKYSRQASVAQIIAPPPSSPDSSLWIEFPVATNDATWLQLNVSKALIEGLTLIAMTRPSDPIDTLGRFLVDTDARRQRAEAEAKRKRDMAIANLPTEKEVRNMQARFKASSWGRGQPPVANAVPGEAELKEEEDGEEPVVDGWVPNAIDEDGIPYAASFASRPKQLAMNMLAKRGSIPIMGPPASTTPPFSPPGTSSKTEAVGGRASTVDARVSTVGEPVRVAAAAEADVEGSVGEEVDAGLAVPLHTEDAERGVTPGLDAAVTSAIDGAARPPKASIEDLLATTDDDGAGTQPVPVDVADPFEAEAGVVGDAIEGAEAPSHAEEVEEEVREEAAGAVAAVEEVEPVFGVDGGVGEEEGVESVSAEVGEVVDAVPAETSGGEEETAVASDE